MQLQRSHGDRALQTHLSRSTWACEHWRTACADAVLTLLGAGFANAAGSAATGAGGGGTGRAGACRAATIVARCPMSPPAAQRADELIWKY